MKKVDVVGIVLRPRSRWSNVWSVGVAHCSVIDDRWWMADYLWWMNMLGGSKDRHFFGGRKKIDALASTCQEYFLFHARVQTGQTSDIYEHNT